jgi:c-di-GMP-binding flagellar brake protein YcgR
LATEYEQLQQFLARLDLSPWELLPGLILMGLIGLGLIQWWQKRPPQRTRRVKQRSERVPVPIPLIISTPVTQEFSVKTYDISLTGAFLHYQDLQNSMTFTSLLGKRSGIKVGDIIEVRVITGRFSHFHCQARVARFCLDENTQSRPGIGIEFLYLSPRKKSRLANIIYQPKIKFTAS